jgi:hypothetical protein
MKIPTFAAAIALGLFVSSAAFGQDAATPEKPDAPAKADKATPDKPDAAAKAEKVKERDERAAECTKLADAKGLHLKARKKFREECKKAKDIKDVK